MIAKMKSVAGRAPAALRMASNASRSSHRCSFRLSWCLVFFAGGDAPAPFAFDPAMSMEKAFAGAFRFWEEEEEEAIPSV